MVVPLGDIAFPNTNYATDFPGVDGWAKLTKESSSSDAAEISNTELKVRWANESWAMEKQTPAFYRDFRFRRWRQNRDGLWICPIFGKQGFGSYLG